MVHVATSKSCPHLYGVTHVGGVKKNSYATPKQKRKNVAGKKRTRHPTKTCGGIKTATPTQREKKSSARKKHNTTHSTQANFDLLLYRGKSGSGKEPRTKQARAASLGFCMDLLFVHLIFIEWFPCYCHTTTTYLYERLFGSILVYFSVV